MLQFEEETLLGFICELSPNDILHTWTRRQDEFLNANASALRNSALKSWNLYSVFLAGIPDAANQTQLAVIQEDFRATRKIVQTAIATAADVMRSLYPFIPIQNIAALETTDSLRKLRGRLSGLPTPAVAALLDEAIDEDSLLRIFQDSHEDKAD
jgi:hypothetical protein